MPERLRKNLLLLALCAMTLLVLRLYQNRPESRVSVSRQVVRASNGLAFSLFQQISAQRSNDNLFLAPTTVFAGLGMIYNGSDGDTRKGIARVLSSDGVSMREFNSGASSLLTSLMQCEPQVTLDISNSLWVADGITLNRDYLLQVSHYYRATPTNVDFRSPYASARINSWIGRRTHGRIGSVIRRLTDQDGMLLINAMYFKGRWTTRFDKRRTEDAPFLVPNCGWKMVSMMSQTSDFSYLEGDGFSAVRLPYGKERFSMYIFLPSVTSDLSTFRRSLNNDNWELWMHRFRHRRLVLRLPRFRIDCQTDLRDPLCRLGMGNALDRRLASFSSLGKPRTVESRVWLSDVVHRTFIEVNEQGTEAAAVSIGKIAVSSSVPPAFVANRPFFFAVRDDRDGAVLFVGSLSDPAPGRPAIAGSLPEQ